MTDKKDDPHGSLNVSFKTRARTVDHLGRGQIADAPTAVSELWKNAWDAYSSSVSLNIFDGKPIVAAIFDSGIGMSTADFVDRWLVIGTESKIDGAPPPPPPFFVGKARPRQGEKGIGRLSTAFLAPATLVVSRQDGGEFSAVLVDWRLFENPFLSIDEIELPVRRFASRSDILDGVPEMAAALLRNIGEVAKDGSRELKPAWDRSPEEAPNPAADPNRIIEFWKEQPIQQRHLDEWLVYAGLEDHGTALYLLGAHHELSVWLHSSHQDEEAEAAKQRLMDILTGFTDSLTDDPVSFDYEVLLHRGAGSQRVLSSTDVFDLADFRDLEHTVEGRFDEKGTFRGKVRAFGKDLGEREIAPTRPIPLASRPGPFDFAIGTFEQVSTSSTHTEKRHRDLAEQVARYGGVRVYRDGLRVMPYGSIDADFFGLEEQRQKHAGRYFWAHRRSFGRLAFTRENNPELRDKAGREGLVENQSSRQLRLLVQSLLLRLALDYFGTDAPERAEKIAETKKRNQKGRKAADQARKRRRSAFRAYLNDAITRMPDLSDRVQAIGDKLSGEGASLEREALKLVRGDVERARAEFAALTPAEVPSSLGDLELKYRGFRDNLDEVGELLAVSENVLRGLEAEAGKASVREVAIAAQMHHRKALEGLLDDYHRQIRDGIRELTENWTSSFASDCERYDRDTAPLMKNLGKDSDLADLLALLDSTRAELEEEFSDRYRAVVQNMAAIIDGVDTQTALAMVDDDREDLDRKVRDLNAVAQLGITVEIIGHELENLDNEVSRSLERLPEEARSSPSFQRAVDSHRALTEKLRFLAPLQLAGARIRETISGQAIFEYVRDFFGSLFADNDVFFEATENFRAIKFTELRSRIYPVFINLTNNSLYWVANSPEKTIRFDYIDGKIIVGDSGPGVDKDDVWRLFELFYTKRTSGRGVGLYLCRVNLEAGRHTIRYAEETDPHILTGANFVIQLRGLSDDR